MSSQQVCQNPHRDLGPGDEKSVWLLGRHHAQSISRCRYRTDHTHRGSVHQYLHQRLGEEGIADNQNFARFHE